MKILHSNHLMKVLSKVRHSRPFKMKSYGVVIKGSITRLTLYPQLKTYQTPILKASANRQSYISLSSH